MEKLLYKNLIWSIIDLREVISMIKTLCWILAACFALYILGALTLPFINIEIFPFFLGIIFFVGILSAVSLIIALIIERIKDKEAEKDDLSKY